MLCGEAVVVNRGVDEARAVSLKCRAWTCENCREERQAQLVALAKSGNPTTFITLTTNPARGASPAERARSLADAWRHVVKRAKKKYGYKHIPYLCVFEATKRGEPHLHILVRVKWISQRWLSDQMRELIGAPIVDVRKVHGKSAIAAYVSKYIGKDPQRFGKCKRYWCTQSWDQDGYEPEAIEGTWSSKWTVEKHPIAVIEAHWRDLGWEVAYVGCVLVGRDRWGSECRREGYHG